MKCNECTAPADACNYCDKMDATPIVFNEPCCKDGVCGINWGDEDVEKTNKE